MNTIRSRGVLAAVAAPVAAAGLLAGTLGISAVANASSVIPGVNTRTSGMVLSKEYISMQKEEHGAAAKPVDLQMQQEASQPDSPAAQEANEVKGNLMAEEVKAAALAKVESLANVQTPEPKSHAYVLKNPVRKHLGMMKAGFSQTAR
ncbi:MAG TPA: hypothetical protein VJR50_02455 [Mycobacterium sp.]|jgi:hypothetical protein|nr:hypothetical protein [Mycobacterium sp.]